MDIKSKYQFVSTFICMHNLIFKKPKFVWMKYHKLKWKCRKKNIKCSKYYLTRSSKNGLKKTSWMAYLCKVQHQQRPKECVDICVCTYTHEHTYPIPCLFPEQLTSCNQKILYFVCVKEIRWVLDMAVHHCRVIGYLCGIIKTLPFFR